MEYFSRKCDLNFLLSFYFLFLDQTDRLGRMEESLSDVMLEFSFILLVKSRLGLLKACDNVMITLTRHKALYILFDSVIKVCSLLRSSDGPLKHQHGPGYAY